MSNTIASHKCHAISTPQLELPRFPLPPTVRDENSTNITTKTNNANLNGSIESYLNRFCFKST